VPKIADPAELRPMAGSPRRALPSSGRRSVWEAMPSLAVARTTWASRSCATCWRASLRDLATAWIQDRRGYADQPVMYKEC
jgi:hypothetical protein